MAPLQAQTRYARHLGVEQGLDRATVVSAARLATPHDGAVVVLGAVEGGVVAGAALRIAELEEPLGMAIAERRRTLWLGTFLLVLMVAGGASVVYRAHVAVLVGLERQRTRIAMDLHDELGSGLGSIGILSGVLSTDGLDPDQRTALAREIARTAGELGSALSDIVWSLDGRAITLGELAARLAEHGRRMFSHGSIAFTARYAPPSAGAPLSLSVRRNVALIALEALHNAARHSGARHVSLRMAGRGGVVEIVVEDDGCGLPPLATRRSGMGLLSMRRRAEEIGATLRWSEPPTGGTTVTLLFRLRAGAGRSVWPGRRRWNRACVAERLT